jgi:hypothetical protein
MLFSTMDPTTSNDKQESRIRMDSALRKTAACQMTTECSRKKVQQLKYFRSVRYPFWATALLHLVESTLFAIAWPPRSILREWRAHSRPFSIVADLWTCCKCSK